MFNEYKEHADTIKEIVFDFITIYGPTNTWTEDIHLLLREEVERRIKEDK